MLKISKAGKIILASGILVLLSAGVVAASPLGKRVFQKTKENIKKVIIKPTLTKLTVSPSPAVSTASASLAPTTTPSPIAENPLYGMALITLHKGTQAYCYSDHLAQIKEADQALRNNSDTITQCYQELNALSDPAQRYQASLKCDSLADNSILQTWTSLKQQYCVDKLFYDKFGWPSDFPRN